MNGAVPAAAQDLRQATRIVAVGLVAHGGQRGGGLARLQANHLKACLLQAVGQVLREGAGFEPDLLDLETESTQAGHNDVDLGGNLVLVPHHTSFVDHADRHGTQRHIDTGEVLHRDLSFAGWVSCESMESSTLRSGQPDYRCFGSR